MRLRFRPRYANVVATLALLFAASGTAYAVTKLPPNSVDTQAIQDGAVTNPKIHVNSVLGNRIKDETLTGTDIADGSVGNSDLGVDSVQAIQIADNTIDGGEIIDNSMGSADIAPDAIGNSELADDSVGSSNVANESLTLSDLLGANVSGAISFSLGANSCGTLNMTAGGAQVGQAVLFTYTGTVALPSAVMMSPFRVTATNTVTTRACNVSSSSMSVTGIAVRIVTFG
jgi:hypothetical protein